MQECLFVLIVDECADISAPAQDFLEYLLSSSSKLNVQSDVADLFSRLVPHVRVDLMWGHRGFLLQNKFSL